MLVDGGQLAIPEHGRDPTVRQERDLERIELEQLPAVPAVA